MIIISNCYRYFGHVTIVYIQVLKYKQAFKNKLSLLQLRISQTVFLDMNPFKPHVHFVRNFCSLQLYSYIFKSPWVSHHYSSSWINIILPHNWDCLNSKSWTGLQLDNKSQNVENEWHYLIGSKPIQIKPNVCLIQLKIQVLMNTPFAHHRQFSNHPNHSLSRPFFFTLWEKNRAYEPPLQESIVACCFKTLHLLLLSCHYKEHWTFFPKAKSLSLHMVMPPFVGNLKNRFIPFMWLFL
jgi:hypothetical protein